MGELRLKKRQPDFLLLLAFAGLLVVGLIMVFSASQYMAGDSSATQDGLYYLKLQAKWALLGIGVMVLVIRMDYRSLKKLAVPGLIIALIFLLLVKIGPSASALGAERSLVLGPIHFQPSELAKIALVLFFAYNMSKNQAVMGNFKEGFLYHFGILAVFCLLIMLQPDLGTCVALVGACFLMMVAGGVRPKYLLTMILAGCFMVGVAILLEPFRMKRFTAFLNPWADAQGYGFQTVQSLIAIGSGGLTGTGLGAGGSKWYYLPEVHTDFIFSIIGEELGFIGAVFVVALFGLLIWRGLRVALSVEDSFASLLALGITVMIGVQTMINLFVATGLMPVTGIALPFISYGGTSLLITMASVGLLLNLSCYMPKGGS